MSKSNPFRKFLSAEDLIHESLLTYLGYAYPKLVEWVYHTPNEGKRTPYERFKASILGIRSGVQDLVFPFPQPSCANSGYITCGLYLELKAPNGKESGHQKRWREFLSQVGYTCKIAYSGDEARAIVDEYLAFTKLPGYTIPVIPPVPEPKRRTPKFKLK